MVNSLRTNAIRGLSNYMMLEASSKDKRFRSVADKFNKRESDSIEADR